MASEDELRACPRCDREIHRGAWRCFHCGFRIWLYDHPAPRRPELE